MPLDLSAVGISPEVASPLWPSASDSVQSRVVELTSQLFGGPVAVTRELDPETNAEYVVVTATARGTVEEIVSASDHWHRALSDCCGESAGAYRLAIDPQ